MFASDANIRGIQGLIRSRKFIATAVTCLPIILVVFGMGFVMSFVMGFVVAER